MDGGVFKIALITYVKLILSDEYHKGSGLFTIVNRTNRLTDQKFIYEEGLKTFIFLLRKSGVYKKTQIVHGDNTSISITKY